MMRLELVTPPAAEPILRADAKLFLRVDSDIMVDDGLIDSLITTARMQAEEITGRALITQTWRLTGLPDGQVINLPRSPVASISSVTDDRGILTATDYAAFTGDFARIAADWQGEATITYVCGYGAEGASVPAPIRTWMQMRITTLYQHRSQIIDGMPIAELPRSLVDALLDPYLACWR